MRIPATVCACERRPAELRHERAALIWYSSECACPPRHARARAREHRRMRAISIRYPHARHFHRSPLVAGCVRSPRAAPPFPPPPHTHKRDRHLLPGRAIPVRRPHAPPLVSSHLRCARSPSGPDHAWSAAPRGMCCPARCLCCRQPYCRHAGGPLTACLTAIRCAIRSAIRRAMQSSMP